MKKFLINFSLFFIIGVVIPAVILYSLPATPYAKSSMLSQAIRNDSSLKNTPAPRIVFVGGSNTSFGIMSSVVKDSLKLNPINTGIHAGIGLMYILDRTEPLIKSGDLVVVIPEYQHFMNDLAYGGAELFRTVKDVDNKSFFSMSYKQQLGALKFLSNYCFSKIDPAQYNFQPVPHYSVSSFNEFGDVFSHYNSPHQELGVTQLNGEINPEVISHLKKFETDLVQRGAKVWISFPCIAQTSFDTSLSTIKSIEKELKLQNFKLIGSPERYAMPDTLFFNTIYHPTKAGLDLRTSRLIEDLKNASDK